MNSLAPAIKRILERLDGLSIRERGIVFITILIVLYASAELIVFPSVWSMQDKITKQIEVKRARTAVVQKEIDALAGKLAGNVDEHNRARIAELREKLKLDRAGNESKKLGMVHPNDMTALLGQLIARASGLQLVRLESAGSKPVTAIGSAAAQPVSDAAAVFRHAIRIEVKGQYGDLVAYMRALDQLRWQIYWDEASLHVERHPVSRLSLVVSTLSSSPVWIGL